MIALYNAGSPPPLPKKSVEVRLMASRLETREGTQRLSRDGSSKQPRTTKIIIPNCARLDPSTRESHKGGSTWMFQHFRLRFGLRIKHASRLPFLGDSGGKLPGSVSQG